MSFIRNLRFDREVRITSESGPVGPKEDPRSDGRLLRRSARVMSWVRSTRPDVPFFSENDRRRGRVRRGVSVLNLKLIYSLL